MRDAFPVSIQPTNQPDLLIEGPAGLAPQYIGIGTLDLHGFLGEVLSPRGDRKRARPQLVEKGHLLQRRYAQIARQPKLIDGGARNRCGCRNRKPRRVGHALGTHSARDLLIDPDSRVAEGVTERLVAVPGVDGLAVDRAHLGRPI